MISSPTKTAATNLDELLSYHDEHFIHKAYLTLLGRTPDLEGLSYYLRRIRSGISKLEILAQLSSSVEGKSRNTNIAGLNAAMKHARLLKVPLIGGILRLSNSYQSRAELQKSLRAIDNNIYATNIKIEQHIEKIEILITDLQKKIEKNKIVIEYEKKNPSNKIRSKDTFVDTSYLNRTTGPSTIIDEAQIDKVDSKLCQLYKSQEDDCEYDLNEERIRHKDYILLIEESKLFDSAFYLYQYTIDEIFKSEPILHYVLFGEARGLQPYSGFWPLNYLKFNTDIAEARVIPFLHYLQQGVREGRTSFPLPPIEGGLRFTPIPILRGREFVTPKNIAVCLHIYYEDLWDEFDEILSRLSHPFDLFAVIIDRGHSLQTIKDKIKQAFPDVRILVFPNHGRDIFPFALMAASGLLDPYNAVCKIHTKKSPHREDGQKWRNQLINGILPEKYTDKFVQEFLSDDKIGILVADGQIYEGDQWWGSNNKNRVLELLQRVEIRHSIDNLRFPAGSIYWIKNPIINLIRGMQLTADDFEVEDSQLDGTTAHSFERTLGFLAEVADLKVVQTSEMMTQALKAKSKFIKKNKNVKPFVSCFYLPQFHPIPENDAWWGKGYTEWIGAAKAKPQYQGHYQPVVPVGTGYYDLRQPEVLGQQFKLAKSHGIDAFCVYYYWFDNGKRLLEAPIDNLISRPDIDACFYLCWANESWTRNWDGLSGEILMSQTYLSGFEADLAKDSAQYFRDPRYYRIDGIEPRFVIYRPEDIPDLIGVVGRLRDEWKKLGFAKVNLGAVLFHLNSEPDELTASLFDFLIEMPPHGLIGESDWIVNKESSNHDSEFPVHKNFDGLVYSYEKLIRNSVNRVFPKIIKDKVIRGVMPSWDNTARRGNRSHICFGSNPARLGYWIDSLLKLNTTTNELFINSWNEWGEKAMVEPSCQYGNGYITSIQNSLNKFTDN